jgi:hypothetical protein
MAAMRLSAQKTPQWMMDGTKRKVTMFEESKVGDNG